ncbi:Transmembrane protein [Phaffia rhodozyma]|uniref:Transmembrane protein n=1 Tax=Phaffia rhodozyma TaxID=264483 RepID=A0A0F7SJY7_PHARH|nr:Transmembrane protein [Phaffia rhodozyma]
MSAPPTAVASPAGGRGTGGGGGSQEESTASTLWSYARTAIMVYAGSQIMNKLMANVIPQPPAAVPTADSVGESASGLAGAPLDPRLKPKADPITYRPFWEESTSMDMYIYFSTSPSGDVDFGQDGGSPSIVWKDLVYGDWKINDFKDIQVDLPASVQRNASLWADIFLTNGHVSPDPSDPKYNASAVAHSRKLLTRYAPKKKIRKEKSLIGGKDDEEEEDVILSLAQIEEEHKTTPIISYWHPNLTLAIVSDRPNIIEQALPPDSKEFVLLEPSGEKDKEGRLGHYPIVYPNDFWNMKDQLIEINSTTPTLPLRISIYSMSYWKFTIYSSVGAGMEKQAAAQGGTGGEMDEFKRVLVETNPFLLGATVLVSILHMLFEFLAFSSDVSHWRKKDGDMTGVSLRTILTNCVVQLVTLLYLYDNSQETSWMILLSQGMGLFVEAWKITKIVDIKLVPRSAESQSILPYRLAFEDKKVLSEDERKTQEYDALAFRLVSYGAIPVLMAYTGYSLFYSKHRSWYSFTINTLAQAIYMFGFVQLVPQLIINYKLKSVAHMPMKAMVYKTLSTVVDDFFSFVIKMPLLHRLACFRDDVVFIILLYQRWIYRVDKTRANEYGQVAVDQSDSDSAPEGLSGDVDSETKKTK